MKNSHEESLIFETINDFVEEGRVRSWCRLLSQCTVRCRLTLCSLCSLLSILATILAISQPAQKAAMARLQVAA